MNSHQSEVGEFKNILGLNIFKNKYAISPYETWRERAHAIVEDVCGTRQGTIEPMLSKDERDQLAEYIREMKFMPGGRYIYYAGRPAKFYNNCFSGEQEFITDNGLVKFKDTVGSSVNVLSPVTQQWLPAQVKSFGTQYVYEITFKNVRGKSTKGWSVEATKDHRWVLKDGSTTTNLQEGDVVCATGFWSNYEPDSLGMIHGMVFADGNVHKQKHGFAHQLRLCGDKQSYVDLFEAHGHTVTYPDFAEGDPVVYIKSKFNMKELPNDISKDEYVYGFLSGWTAFDGYSSGTVNQLHSTNYEAMLFFIDHCYLMNTVVSGNLICDTKPTNYGNRKNPLYRLNYNRTSTFQGFKVTDIRPLREEEVYCVVEPEHNLFTLRDGIITGNCYLLKLEEDTREAWSELTYRSMSCLMTGGGIGIDVSVAREQGRPLSRTGGVSSGPIPLLYTLNEVGRNVMQGGSRRSALYGSLSWQHADADQFLKIKNWKDMPVGMTGHTVADIKEQDFNHAAPLDMMNISLNYDDDWLRAAQVGELSDVFVENCRQALMTGEPGFSFNFGPKANETLRNACTEITSEDDSDVCNLGSVNMGNIENLEEFKDVVRLASKFLVCGTVRAELPYDKVYQVRRRNRRLGLGLMGMHEWLLKRGEKYGMTSELKTWLENYEIESEAAANEHCDRFYLSRPKGYRAIAPTGTISLLACTTSGLEPIYATAYKRRYLTDGTRWKYQFTVDSTAQYLIEQGISPDDIESSVDLAADYERRIKFQYDVQKYVDHAISSTLNLPAWGTDLNNEDKVDEFASVVAKYAHGLRGLTCYPDGSRGGQPITSVPYEEAIAKKNTVFEENSDEQCMSGVCSI